MILANVWVTPAVTMAEPIIVSYSELDTFRQCPLKHFLSYRMRYTKPTRVDSALSKGSLYHKVMERHYKLIKAYQIEHGGKNPREGSAAEKLLLQNCEQEVMKILWDPRAGEWHNEICELIFWMYQGHVKNYGTMPDWKIIAVEHNIVEPLRDERGRRTRYHLKMKLDLVVQIRSLGTRWIVDHKSGQNLPTQFELDIDDQFGLYTWGIRMQGRKVQGSLHAANRTQRNKSPMSMDQRMALTYLNRDPVEVTSLALDAYYAARAAYPPKGGEIPKYSSPDPRSCGWKCDFKEPHLLMRRGRSVPEVMLEYGFRIDRTRH